MTKFLKIVSISETQQDKNGRGYVKVTFQPITVLGNGMKIGSNQKPLSRVLWDKNSEGKFGDQLYFDILTKQIGVGDGVEGSTCTVNCTPYVIDDKEVTTYSFVCFAHENPQTYANRQLKNNRASVVIGDLVTAPENLVSAPMTPVA